MEPTADTPKYMLDFTWLFPNPDNLEYRQFRCKKCQVVLPDNEMKLATHWAQCFGPKRYILSPIQAN